MSLDAETLKRLYQTMVRIRRFDERTVELFNEGLVKGTAHSYVGQEAVATGACAHLTVEDSVISNHRGHGHCIAKGARLDLMMAELMGRESGYCRGLGGSMHIAALDLNILGANGIVAAGVPIGAGAALANVLRKHESVVISFFGDGGANQGTVHETMNLAAVWKLPLIFVCENNKYALSTDQTRTTAGEGVTARARALGIPAVRVDGNDLLAVYEAVGEAVGRARRGEGPSSIEAVTYRWGGHSMRANLPEYRTKQEEVEWMARDPLARVERRLSELGVGDLELKELRQRVEGELEAAVAYGVESPEPTVEVMEAAVYAPHARVVEPPSRAGRELTFVEALNAALHQELARDERVFLMGEDVGLIGGIFQVSRGLRERFGEERVRDTPISEPSFVGMGVGAAVAGMRPIVEIQIWDFIAMTMDQVVNQAAKIRYMLGGRPTVPLVIRGPQGGGIRLAAQHSQSLEAWFCHVPGLVVVAPSTPYDAKGLLAAAIRDDNPVIFLEHKMLYSTKGAVPEGEYLIPLGKADVKRPRRRRHRGRHPDDGAARLAGGRRPRAGGRLRRGHRSAHPGAARRGDHPRLGGEDQPPRRRPRGGQAGRLRRGDRGAGDGAGPRSARCADRTGGRAQRPHALQRQARGGDHPLAGRHRGRHPSRAGLMAAAGLHAVPLPPGERPGGGGIGELARHHLVATEGAPSSGTGRSRPGVRRREWLSRPRLCQPGLEVAANALAGSEQVGYAAVRFVQVPSLPLRVVRVAMRDPVPDGDQRAELARRRQRPEPVHQLCHLSPGETPDVLPPDDRHGLEQFVLDRVDELLVSLEEGVESVLDIWTHAADARRRHRKLPRQCLPRPREASGAALGGPKGRGRGQLGLLAPHSRRLSPSAICSMGEYGAPRS